MTTEAPNAEKVILCVDDDQDTCDLVTFMLKSANIQVDAAESVAEGCDKAQANRYDLILLDYRYPDGTGIEICQCVRQLDKQTPILFYSAEAHHESIQQALAAGAQDYLVKPNDTDNLVKRVLFHTNKLAIQQGE